MIKGIELLVHAGAPSSRQHDDGYKAQAEAYAGFNGTRVTLANPSPSPPPSSGTCVSPNQHFEETTVIESPTVFLDDTQLAITALDSQLVTSSIPTPSGKARVSFQVYATPHGKALDDSKDNPEPVTSALVPSTQRRVSHDDLLNQIRSFGKRKRDVIEEPLHHAPNLGAVATQPHEKVPRRTTVSPDAVSLSSYLKTPILDRSAKRPRIGEAKQPQLPSSSAPFSLTNLRKSHSVGPARDGGALAFPAAKSRPGVVMPAVGTQSQGSLHVSEPTSELPTSYSLSDITSESSRAKAGPSQRSASDPGPKSGSHGKLSINAEASTASEGSNGRLVGTDQGFSGTSQRILKTTKPPEVIVIPEDTPQLDVDDPRPCKAVVVDTAPRETKSAGTAPLPAAVNSLPAKPLPAPTQETLDVLRTLPRTLHPPEPVVSIDKFQTHITNALASLASNSDLGDCYKPVTVDRGICPLERGYWLVDCTVWPLQAQIDFWMFLRKAIETGNLGWGLWCCLEDRCEGVDSGRASIGLARIYCWGEIVKHIYLLLYVVSRSKVRKLGLQWIDAGGEIVVQMRHG